MSRGLALAALALLALASPASAQPLLWQTSSEGDDVHVFDLSRRVRVARIEVGPEPHGIAAPDDGHVVFVSLEANDAPRGELLWIDPDTFRIRHRMTLCPEPHAIATTPDGRFVYVPCRDGYYWVVDARARAVVTRIHTGGRPHNTKISREGRLALLSPMGRSARVTVVDIQAGHAVVGTIPFAGSVRPSALSADGRLFQHVDGLNGFQVADVAARRVVATIEHATPLGWLLLHPMAGWLGVSGLQRCHGLALRPGEHEIWSVCGASVTIHGLTGTYTELARVPLESKGYWISFSPDGRRALVALSDADRVAVVDADTRRVLAHFDTGPAPKRNLVIDASPALDDPHGRMSR